METTSFTHKVKPATLAWTFIGMYILLVLIALKLFSPPKALPESASGNGFSAERALDHLKKVAAFPHSAGQSEHQKVVEYIAAYCAKNGLEVSLQDSTGIRSNPGLVIAGSPRNIIARRKGDSSRKALLVVGHYDSQFNTPGASDNGAAVSSMLEVIQLLSREKKQRNDIVFLFTDQEEMGLLGAESFVHTWPGIDSIGFVLNFDARGNAGPVLTFEISEPNGWAVSRYAKSVSHPYANSFLYEAYKLLPNDTDFSMFRKKKISGLNSAFADGYTYYHSAADTYGNLDLNTLQDEGDNMLSLVRYFGNTDLSNTRAADVIFFNPVGDWLIVFPKSLDILFISLITFGFAWLVYLGITKNRLTFGKMLLGALFTLIAIILSVVLGIVVVKTVSSLYPHYSNFKGSTFYNTNYYLLSFWGISLLSFVLIAGSRIRRWQTDSMVFGGMLLLVITMFLMKIFLNTAAYVIYFPMFFIETIYLWHYLANVRYENKPVTYSLTQLLPLAPAILFWAPFIYLLYIMFGFSAPYGAMIAVAFSFPFMVPGLKHALTVYKRYVPLSLLAVIITGLILGHISSGYTQQQPLLTNLMYAVDFDTNKALWVSDNNKLDEWNRKYIHTARKEKFNEFYPEWNMYLWKGNAPLIADIKKGSITILSDTSDNSVRRLSLLVASRDSVNSVELWFPDSTAVTKINDRDVFKKNSAIANRYTRFKYYAPSPAGFKVDVAMPKSAKLTIKFIERKIGLPGSLIKEPLPNSIGNGPGELSNSIQWKQTLSL
jgi:hypothetical protein